MYEGYVHKDIREGAVIGYGGRTEFLEWLHVSEYGQPLLEWGARTPRNAVWARGVLGRWRDAGYPDPERRTEIRHAPLLRLEYLASCSSWTDLRWLNHC